MPAPQIDRDNLAAIIGDNDDAMYDTTERDIFRFISDRYDEIETEAPDETVLADLASKREIVDECWKILTDHNPPEALVLASQTLRHLAVQFSNHPDHQPEWLPRP